MSSRHFTTGVSRETVAFERSPLLVSTARRQLGRPAWFTIGIVIGILVEALVR